MRTMSNTPTSGKTLDQALRDTYADRWANTRSANTTLSQAERAAEDLARSVWHAEHPTTYLYDPGSNPYSKSVTVSTVCSPDVRRTVAQWYAQGLSPATITKRLNCLSAMGVSVEGMRPPKDRKLQWWLRPEEEERADWWLEGCMLPEADILARFIRWTTRTGLRVEESLRLEWSDFSGDFRSITVPGLKTATSQASLPIGVRAGSAVRDWKELEAKPFDITYEQLEGLWRKLRTAMGWPEAATLKALRRSAARYLHVDCGMPLHMVQQYLRHENMETTLGYLRLTGGYGTEEMRRYLK